MTMEFLIFLYFIITSTECKSQEINPCVWKETCGECIQQDPRCGWCSQEDFTRRKISRCDFIEKLEERNCSDLVNPSNSMTDDLNLPFSEKGAHPESVVQIKPQDKTIKLRANSPVTFSLEYRQVLDYPIDLYYLLDVSHSMKAHVKDLGDMAAEFAGSIGTVSSDFTLGVGSFFDETTFSDNSNQATKLQNPVFVNKLPLRKTRVLVEFSRKTKSLVKELSDSSGHDSVSTPVGILDAIMQVMVCKEEIGWRNSSKKVLVVAIGNDFHYAGDGKLTGSIKPNDGQCHLDAREHYMEQDYPSLSQINRKIKEHNITVIFAATQNFSNVYSELSTKLFGSVTGELANQTDIIRLVKEQYQAMSTSLEMPSTIQGSNNIQITYNSSCLGDVNKETNLCTGIKPGDTVAFNVTLKYSSCPKGYKDIEHKTIEINPVGRSSNLQIKLEMICGCDCKNPTDKGVKNRCSRKGDYQCGVCVCESNTYGTDCECDGVEGLARPDDRECKRGNEERVCSGRGECSCGKCICDQIKEHPTAYYYEKYCECSDYSCYQINNKICNGHGMCNCGKCNCHEGWSGSDCTCSNTTENCPVDSDGVMCSGHGTCYCGSCKCDETYYGQYCEDCPSCPGKCEEYSACVRCILSRNDDETPENNCTEACEMKDVTLVDTVEVNESLHEKACSIQDENGCHIFFKYEKGHNKSAIIHAQETIECPAPPDVLAIVAGTIGSIVLAGIILLIMWKILTHVHDTREFAKFEQERRDAKWDATQNPIFIEPTSTFPNPVYERSQPFEDKVTLKSTFPRQGPTTG